MTEKTLTTIVQTSTELAPVVDQRDDQNPAMVYIASLESENSKRAMKHALNWIAIHILHIPQQLIAVKGKRKVAEDVTYQGVPWGRLTYQYTQAIRAELARQFKYTTANNMLAALRGVLKEAYRLGQMPHEAYVNAVDLKPVRGGGEAPTGRELGIDEVKLLVKACKKDPSPAGARDAAIIGMMWACGLRRSEPVALDLKHYDPETGQIVVKGKGNKTRAVYAANGAGQALDDWIVVRGNEPGPLFCPVNKGGKLSTGKRMTAQALYNVLGKRAKEAGIDKPFSPHDFRRTFAGELLDRGIDLVTVQKLMGHANPTTTARYDRRGEETKRKAASTLHFPY